MKQLLIAVFSLCCFSANAQQSYALKTDGLKGKVKTVTKKWTYRYMPDGKQFTDWKWSGGSVVTYSAKGQLVSREEQGNDGVVQNRSKYIYKSDGSGYEIRYQRPDGSKSGWAVFTTNEKGAPLEETRFDTAGKVWSRHAYSYDSENHLMKTDGFRGDGSISSQIFYKLDEKGNRIEMKTVTPKYATSYQYYQYDDKGRISVERWPSVAGSKTFRFERTYDDKGNKIREVKFIDEVQRGTATWVYEYDRQGNWTKQTEYTTEGEPFSIYERTITYY